LVRRECNSKTSVITATFYAASQCGLQYQNLLQSGLLGTENSKALFVLIDVIVFDLSDSLFRCVSLTQTQEKFHWQRIWAWNITKPKKESRMAKGRGWGLRRGLKQLHTHTQLEREMPGLLRAFW